MTDAAKQEQYAAVWPAASAVADRLASEAVEYDDEDGRAFNLTVATGIIASAMLSPEAKPTEGAKPTPEERASDAEATAVLMIRQHRQQQEHYGRLIDELADAGKALVDAITFDESGAMVAGKYQGGNGGLISRQTIIKADQLRRALAKVGR